MNKILLLDVIHCYVATATANAAKLRAELQADDLLRAVKSGRVPTSGSLSDGTRYRFHGVGCRIEGPKVSIDFDFGPDGRCDGFDAWRLRSFAERLPAFAALSDINAIESGLALLTSKAVVVRPQWEPSPHLFYLAGGP